MSQESGNRSQKSEVRSQETGVRSQVTGVRRQEAAVGMQVFVFPECESWLDLCKRPVQDFRLLEKPVRGILKQVKNEGDKALFELTEKFDGVKLTSLNSKPETQNFKPETLNSKLREAIGLAKSNIEIFHAAQLKVEPAIETMPGVTCWRKSIPIEKVGLYIPGGTAPLFSTLLMLGIPAKLAGCKEIVVCTPIGKDGKIDPAILFTAQLIGIDKIHTVGGAQAIAAMAYGTETIPKVDKIFGPGNQYVTMAKQLVQQEGVAIDMPAGPSEVLVIADESCNPEFVAADLLSQAEHGPDSQVMLVVCNSSQESEVRSQEGLVEKILGAVAKQLLGLPRREFAEGALKNSKAIVVKNTDEAMAFSNLYAPEHLIIATSNADELAEKVINAGSVFLGNYSCESAGDYASGTNHTLPTNGFARSYSGVSMDSFVKKVTFQKLNETGLKKIGSAIEQMAEAEQLQAHKNAVSIRLKSLKDV